MIEVIKSARVKRSELQEPLLWSSSLKVYFILFNNIFTPDVGA